MEKEKRKIENIYNTILAIDTSCDDTSVAVIHKNKILANVISSQIKEHQKWGGVVPGLAKKLHEERIEGVVELALREANEQIASFDTAQDDGKWHLPALGLRQARIANKKQIKKGRRKKEKSEEEELDPVVRQAYHDNRMAIDAVAVTQGPGLSIALGVGIAKAKELALEWNVPLIPVDHMEGHLFSSLVNSQNTSDFEIGDLEFPLLGVLVSGGHTELIKVSGVGEYEILGQTLDDALGEAFDKVARILGLGYPGGPIVAKLAEEGDPYAYELPIPMKNSDSLDLSYSGLKTAVLYLVRDLKGEDRVQERRKKQSWEPESTDIISDNLEEGKILPSLSEKQIADICASFQRVAIEALILKIKKALKLYKFNSILLGGGVAQNKYLQRRLKMIVGTQDFAFLQKSLQIFIPQDKKLFMDNAAMIGFTGYLEQFKKLPVILETKEEIQSLDRKPARRIASSK